MKLLGPELSSAERSRLVELCENPQGCTTFPDKSLDDMLCTTVTTTAGDLLYIPRGVVHSVQSPTGSVHVTLSLRQDKVLWKDFITREMEEVGDAALVQGLHTALQGLLDSHPKYGMHNRNGGCCVHNQYLLAEGVVAPRAHCGRPNSGEPSQHAPTQTAHITPEKLSCKHTTCLPSFF